MVAKVNGEDIHLSDISAAAQTCRRNTGTCRGQTLYPLLLDQLIDQKALVLLARKQGLDKDPGGRQADAARATDQALQTALISRAVGPQVTEAGAARSATTRTSRASRARRKSMPAISSSRPRTKRTRSSPSSRRARDFAALAKQHSTDPGAAHGGDLGLLQEAPTWCPSSPRPRSRCKPGQIADKPVHTQFGWHVIQMMEVRQAPPPTFEQAA